MKHQPVMKPQIGDEPSSHPETPRMAINHQLLMKPPNGNETQTRPETSQQMKYGEAICAISTSIVNLKKILIWH
jgi:hypothetical protein